jgi:hypothetical protein
VCSSPCSATLETTSSASLQLCRQAPVPMAACSSCLNRDSGPLFGWASIELRCGPAVSQGVHPQLCPGGLPEGAARQWRQVEMEYASTRHHHRRQSWWVSPDSRLEHFSMLLVWALILCKRDTARLPPARCRVATCDPTTYQLMRMFQSWLLCTTARLCGNAHSTKLSSLGDVHVC